MPHQNPEILGEKAWPFEAEKGSQIQLVTGRP
jgi:hypothetical protein